MKKMGLSKATTIVKTSTSFFVQIEKKFDNASGSPRYLDKALWKTHEW